jgi:hypothetical protein
MASPARNPSKPQDLRFPRPPARYQSASMRQPFCVVFGLALAAAATITACESPEPEPASVVRGEHPFDLLPERGLGDPVVEVDPEVDFVLLRIPRLARVSEDSFVAPIRAADGSMGVAHVGLDGQIRSWILEQEEFESLAGRGRTDRFGLGLVADTVWFEAASFYGVTFHLRSLAGDDLGEVSAPMQSLQLVPQRMGGAASGLLVDGRAWLDLDGHRRNLWAPQARNFDAGLLARSTLDPDASIDTLAYSDDVQVGVGPVRFEPFGHPPLVDVTRTGDRIVIVAWDADRPVDLRVRTLDLSEGGRSVDTTLVLPPLALDTAEVESALQAAVDILAQAPYPELLPRRETVLDSIRMPTYRPVARRVVAGEDGSVWLLRDDPTESIVHASVYRPGAQRWAVLDPEGAPAFQVVLPEGEYLVLAHLDQVWSVGWTDGRLRVWDLSDTRDGEGP